MKSIKVATCQFPVEADIALNQRHILRQIHQAADGQAQIVHFSECALSGYAGVDIPDTGHIDWQQLTQATLEIQEAARARRVWVLLGSTHRLSDTLHPHNSVYVIDPRGRIVDRYDKRFCTGVGGKRPTHDLQHYSPGNRCVTFRVRGITCAVLICYDYRFPELYRELYEQGVNIVFQSFHNARSTVVTDTSYNIWQTIVPSTMACRAAENHFWVSANNSTARPSRWASFAVRPDGWITGRLKKHQSGVLLTQMALDPALFDAPGPWRQAAIDGQLHSGQCVDHARSRDVTCL